MVATTQQNAVRPGYKRTEVGVIPEDWKVQQLRDVTTLMTNGFVGKATPHYTGADDGVVYIQGFNVEENAFNLTGIRRVTRRFHNQHLRSCLREGDLLTIQTGEVGLTTIVSKELEGSNCHALVISRFNNRLYEPKYFSYYFNSSVGRSKFADIETGSTMKHLNVGDMLGVFVPHPPTKAEQSAIASALTDVDGLLASQDKLIAKKRDIKIAAMQQLLTGKQRLPRFSGEWNVKRLGDVAALNRINVIPASFGDQLFVHFSLPAFDAGQLPVVEPGSAIGSNKFRVPQGSVLVSKLNPRIPRVWAPTDIPTEAIASTEFLVLTPREGILRSFLSAVCSSPSFCGQMELAATGTTGSHQRISPTGALDIKVFLPIELPEQAAIAAILSDMEAEIGALQARRDKTQTLKQGTMQQLLTGNVRLI